MNISPAQVNLKEPATEKVLFYLPLYDILCKYILYVGSEKMVRINSKLQLSSSQPTVILTGAGFSKSVGLPLQRELLESVVPPNIIKIHNYFMGRNLEEPADIEEFLSSIDFDEMLESKRQSPERLSSQIYLSGFANLIYDSMCNIAKLPKSIKKEFWKKLATLAEISDTFITLNWDTVIEVQIRALGERIRFKGKDKRSKHILKLHGSIDWYKLSSELQVFDSALFERVFPGYVRYKPLSEEPDLFSISREVADLFNKVHPAIIAPTHLKALPSGAFRKIWASASHTLHFAKHVIIIGYSLPSSDTLMQLLLRNSLRYRLRTDSNDQPKVTVIDPDSTGVVKSRYYELLGDRFEFIQCPFLEVDLEIHD